MRITPKDILIYCLKRMIYYSGSQWSITVDRALVKIFRFLLELVEGILFFPIAVWCLFETIYKTGRVYVKIFKADDGTNKDGEE